NRNSPGMFEPRDDLCLANHPFAQIFCGLRRVEDFYRDETVELSIFSQIDGAHAAAAKLFNERVPRTHNAAQMVQRVVRQPLHFTSSLETFPARGGGSRAARRQGSC